MRIDTRAVLGIAAAAGLLTAAAVEAKAPAKTMPMTTKSPAAHDQLVELQRRIETFQFTANEDLARKIVAADPDFALGEYYLSAVSPAPGNQPHLDKAVELAKGASDAERRFIEAMVLARGKNPEQAVEPLTRLTVDYPSERLFFMLLGQNLAGVGKQEEAKAAFEKAIALDPSTPRAYTFVGNYYLMKGDYEKATETLSRLRAMKKPNLTVGLHSVISRHNVREFPAIADALASLGPDQYIVEPAEERVELQTIGTGITPKAAELDTALAHVEGRLRSRGSDGLPALTRAIRLVYYRLARDTVRRREQVIPCYAAIASVHIAANGDVWGCCTRARPLGNLRDSGYDFRSIWRSAEAKEERRSIKAKECACPLANAAYTSILMDPRSLLSVAREAL